MCRECETEQLRQQIEALTSSIQRERGRTAEMKLRARLFCFGEFRAEDQVTHTHAAPFNITPPRGTNQTHPSVARP